MRDEPRAEPAVEFERLRLLRSLKIDDASLDRSLQQIVERVGPLYGTRLCMINLMLEHVEYTKAWYGPLPPDIAASRTIPRTDAICNHVVASHVPLVIEDMAATADWADHPVARAYGIRFYAGVPLVAHTGHVLGTLCLADTEPGTITAEGLEALQFFASRTAAELELAGEQDQTRRLRAELEQTLRYAETLSELMVELQGLSDPDRVGERALGAICRVASLSWAVLIAVGTKGAWAPYRTGTLPPALADLRERGVRRGTGPIWKLVESRAEGHVVEAALERELVLLVDVPVSSPKLPYFLLVGRDERLGPWTTQDRLLMECTARTVAVALHRCLRLSELENAALTDELTGLGNRRAFEALAARLRPEARYRVLMADLAHFKRLNDTMGHAVGDICLRAVAQTLLREMRPADEAGVFRYGGDEFVIVLPEPGAGGADVGPRLTVAVGDAIQDYLGLGLRLDVGEAHVPAEAPTLGEGLALADARMYGVKRSRGRDPAAE